jgi:hypothetical protein
MVTERRKEGRDTWKKLVADENLRLEADGPQNVDQVLEKKARKGCTQKGDLS